MELDDFKDTWDEMTRQVNDNQIINIKMIDKMGKTKFQSSLKKILLPELFGSIICIVFAIFILFNFDKLNTVSFKIAGLVSVILLIFLPVISLRSVFQLYKAIDINKSYAETLKDFAVQKINFCKLQKINITLSYLLMVTVIIIAARLFGRNEKTDSGYFFITAFSLGYIILFSFSKWVFKKYNRTIQQTEDLLNELAS